MPNTNDYYYFLHTISSSPEPRNSKEINFTIGMPLWYHFTHATQDIVWNGAAINARYLYNAQWWYANELNSENWNQSRMYNMSKPDNVWMMNDGAYPAIVYIYTTMAVVLVFICDKGVWDMSSCISPTTVERSTLTLYEPRWLVKLPYTLGTYSATVYSPDIRVYDVSDKSWYFLTHEGFCGMGTTQERSDNTIRATTYYDRMASDESKWNNIFVCGEPQTRFISSNQSASGTNYDLALGTVQGHVIYWNRSGSVKMEGA